ncbi:hypothetical protein V6O07_23795, partial [Arthrospira platensis SPKY2]
MEIVIEDLLLELKQLINKFNKTVNELQELKQCKKCCFALTAEKKIDLFELNNKIKNLFWTIQSSKDDYKEDIKTFEINDVILEEFIGVTEKDESFKDKFIKALQCDRINELLRNHSLLGTPAYMNINNGADTFKYTFIHLP